MTVLDILHRVGITASKDAVFRALTTTDGLAVWWTEDTTGDGTQIRWDLRTEGDFTIVLFAHEGWREVVEGGVVGLRHVVPLLVLEGEAGG
jgi:uncharacterized protein YndB with AHSA1/START domain